MDYTPKCLQQHLGLWAIESTYVDRLLAFLNSPLGAAYKTEPVVSSSSKGYDVLIGGGAGGPSAVVPLVGHMTKGGDSFGGCSTVRAQRGLQQAVRDGHQRVGLFIDSPGGHVAGTQELAETFRRAGERVETFAHIEDMGASAAYYVASQAHRITANPSSLTGNIGVRAEIVDSSKMAEMDGIKIHLLTTGPFKAIGVPGAEVTPEQVAHEQSIVNDLFGLFVDAVSTGRQLTGGRLAAVTDGRIFTAERALAAGLIDEIGSYHDLYHSEQGGDQVDKEELAQVTTAVLAALMEQGIIPTASANPVEPAEPAPPVQEQQVFPSADLLPPVQPPEEPIPESTESGFDPAAVQSAYLNGFKKGEVSARGQALAILSSCIQSAQITSNTPSEAIRFFHGAVSAIENGDSFAEFQESAYSKRIDEGGQATINNAPPLPEDPNKSKGLTPPAGKVSSITDSDIYAARQASLAGQPA